MSGGGDDDVKNGAPTGKAPKTKAPKVNASGAAGSRKAMGLIAGLLSFAFAVALMATGGAYAGWRWLKAEYQAPGPLTEAVIVELPSGSGLIKIANTLEQAGAVGDAELFRWSVTLIGDERALKAGDYEIRAGASMAEIYQQLRDNDVIAYSITFPEGATSAQIVRRLNEDERLTGEIAAVPPEGSLLPETYRYNRRATRQSILDRMAADQTALIDKAWETRDKTLPVATKAEALILASIVEKETGLAAERPRVAAVFVNRLKKGGMRIESDPTIIYGITGGEPLGRGLRRSELDSTTNPYNTYKIDGLPPTPICNPGRASIEAVLNPPDTKDLFFVADGTGGHVFAPTYAEHQRNVANWRRVEREKKQGGGR